MSKGTEDRIVAIAGMSGIDTELHALVKEVLSERGIWSSREGSVHYDVLIYEKDATMAMDLLRGDPRLSGKQLTIFTSPRE
jgi:hypothetical protein